MRYLITGHTGFKGAWLTVMLKSLGHEVHGIALPPEKESLFNEAEVANYLTSSTYIDIRDFESLNKAVKKIEPEVIIHLAAQSLVLKSYQDPIGTYETNLMGTLNVLESTKDLENVRAIQIITTDKVYRNVNQEYGYVETDELGGSDPYSSSKSAADLATQAWRSLKGTAPIAISRAGNVIGGGDYSSNRIVPDLVKALAADQSLTLRHPNSIRPWQHVLDCLNGYLILINKQINENTQGEWNFGPHSEQVKSVQDLVNEISLSWGKKVDIKIMHSPKKEADLLLLNSTKSRELLNWSEKLNWHMTANWTADWYKSTDKKKFTFQQVEKFFNE
jgi:CDP-glucose 4,6-dehydratase